MVEVPHPPPVVFAYLGDPRNRPEWQASLLSVTLVDRGEPRLGLAWRETTVIGLRPSLRITAFEPCRHWAEHGTWHGVEADLDLRFTAVGAGCRVRAQGEVRGVGGWAAAARLAGRLAAAAIASDLERAGRILSDRGPR